jgi:hypothetical protein
MDATPKATAAIVSFLIWCFSMVDAAHHQVSSLQPALSAVEPHGAFRWSGVARPLAVRDPDRFNPAQRTEPD